MKEINRENSIKYQNFYKELNQLSINNLYSMLEKQSMEHYGNQQIHLVQIPSSGCYYQNRMGIISGCSMCNLHKDSSRYYAGMKSLRERDEQRYCQLIEALYLKSRGQIRHRSWHEYIFAHNLLNDQEIPESLLETLLKGGPIYCKKPLCYEFETRVDTITENKLRLIKNWIKHDQVIFRFGVETSDERIRNSWLNKGVDNGQIEKAVELCHEYGYKVSANLLIGIPGFTEQISYQVLIDSVLWLDRLGVDTVICSVLSSKKDTLQFFLKEKLSNNPALIQAGIADSHHTGIPWLFTVLRFIRWVMRNRRLQSKISFGQFNSSYYQGEVQQAYNADENCLCNTKIRRILQDIAFTGDWSLAAPMLQEYKSDPCYKSYCNRLIQQSALNSALKNELLVEKEISKKLWPQSWKNYHNRFVAELAY